MSTIDDLAADLKALKRLARILDELSPSGLVAARDLWVEADARRKAEAETARTA